MMILVIDPLMVNGRSNVKVKYAVGEVSQKLFYIFKRILSLVSGVLFRQLQCYKIKNLNKCNNFPYQCVISACERSLH